MTLQTRNNVFKAGSIFTGLTLILAVCAAAAAFSFFPQAMKTSAYRTTGWVNGLIPGNIETSPYIPLITALGAILYSFAGISLIRYFFEKTQAVEIPYIGFFVISMALECGRLMVPLKLAFDLPGVYLFMSSRMIIFSRCFGLFALFTASVCATGLSLDKQRNMIIIAATIALIIALGIPINGLIWDSSLNMHSGYSSMFNLVEAGVSFMTIISFFIAAYIRSAKEYNYISIGIILVLAGRGLFLSSDTWITPIPGIIMLFFGTWLVCTRLHRVYLWL